MRTDTLIENSKPLIFIKSRVSIAVISILLSLLLAVIGTAIAVNISKAFYSVAPFHYDSASYLWGALQVYDSLSSLTWFKVLLHSFYLKDSLDITLRLLIAPSSLNNIFGHLVIAAPLMAATMSLIIYYVYNKTASWVLAVCAASFLFSFPLIFSPYMGIADYWKESIAVWFFASAIVCWLLAKNFNSLFWSILCSVFLGGLVLERPALAIYAAILFLPLVIFAFVDFAKVNGMKSASLRLFCFSLPAGTLTLLLATLQWKMLYEYYFISGYAYLSSKDTYYNIKELVKIYIKTPLSLIVLGGVLSLLLVKNWKYQWKEIAATTWLTLGFPLIIVLLGTAYEGFIPVWTVLLVISLAVYIPYNYSANRFLKITLAGFALFGAIYQFYHTQTFARDYAKPTANFQQLYSKFSQLIFAQKNPRYVSFMFDEQIVPYLEYLRLYKNLPLDQIKIKFVGFMAVHDSYYTPPKHDVMQFVNGKVEGNINVLEKNPGTLVFIYCNKDAFAKSLAFNFDSKTVVTPYVLNHINYLKTNKNWKLIERINDPHYQALCVYKYK